MTKPVEDFQPSAMEELESAEMKAASERAEEEDVLKATSDLARLTGVYYGTLKALGLPSDVIKVLTRDYARLTLTHYYGDTGETLEE